MMENNLPKDWVEVELEQAAAFGEYPIGDGDHGQIKPSMYQNEGIPYIRVSDMGWGNLDLSHVVYISEEIHKANPKSELKPDDVLIAKTGATIGKCGILPCTVLTANTTSSVGKITLNKEIMLPKWLLYFFLSNEFKEFMWSISERTAQPGFNNRDIKKFIIPLAPLPEQYRIVARLEALMEKIERNKQRLDKIPTLLKRFRQSVLAAAVSGRLTEEWREKNGDIENASKLITKIIKERKEKYENHCTIAERNGIKKPPKPVLDIIDFDDTELPIIPVNWIWLKGQSLFERIFDGTHFSPKNLPEGKYKYITAKNIKDWGIDLSNITYVSEKDHKEIYSRADVKLFDVLYIKDGATAGIATINNLDEEFSLLSSVGVFRCNLRYLLPKYIVFYLNGSKERMLENISGVAITRLTIEKLKDAKFCLPTFEEQQEIVRRVEHLFAFADKVEARYTKAKAMLDKLPQSILAKAFRGELVPQDENDEPASELLKRIKAEKEKFKRVSINHKKRS